MTTRRRRKHQLFRPQRTRSMALAEPLQLIRRRARLAGRACGTRKQQAQGLPLANNRRIITSTLVHVPGRGPLSLARAARARAVSNPARCSAIRAISSGKSSSAAACDASRQASSPRVESGCLRGEIDSTLTHSERGSNATSSTRNERRDAPACALASAFFQAAHPDRATQNLRRRAALLRRGG